MSVILDVRSDVSAVTRHLSRLANEQIPYATARALTKTAQFVERKLVDEMRRSLDRPTPYTLKGLYVQPATKQRLWALVKVKDTSTGLDRVSGRNNKGVPAVRYLLPQIQGGRRGRKGFEERLADAGWLPAGWYAVPASGAKLDAYGNVPRSTLNRILSQLQASRDPLARESVSNRRRRNARQMTGRYFVAYPGRPKTAHLKPGIYERLSAFGASGVRPVFVFTQKAPRYRRRLRFYEVADQTARMRFPIEFALAAREAIRTAR